MPRNGHAMKGNIYLLSTQKLIDENSTLSADDPKYFTNETKIKEAYELALPFYEKAKEVEPENKDLWGQVLYRIYYNLNNPKFQDLEN